MLAAAIAARLLQVRIINKAGGVRTLQWISTADWTPSDCIEPSLSAVLSAAVPGAAAASFVVPKGVVPPGGSPYGGIRGLSWIGPSAEQLAVHVVHPTTGIYTCADPESGIFVARISVGLTKGGREVVAPMTFAPNASAYIPVTAFREAAIRPIEKQACDLISDPTPPTRPVLPYTSPPHHTSSHLTSI